jgi:paraquat-inducible protein A
MATKTNNLFACPECDALQRAPVLLPHHAADCVRCGAELFRNKPASVETTLAFMLAAAVAFFIAVSFPLMELEAKGDIRSSSTIYGLVEALFASGWPSVALLVLVTVIVVPFAQLATALYILVPLKLGRVPQNLRAAVRLLDSIWRWGMVEVFMLGAIVSLVKLTKLASVHIGLALYAVGLYVLLIAAAVASFDAHSLWRRVEELRA